MGDFNKIMVKKTDPSKNSIEEPKSQTEQNIYCLKCKQKRDITNVQQTTLKNGKPAYAGICPVCGTKVFRFMATTR